MDGQWINWRSKVGRQVKFDRGWITFYGWTFQVTSEACALVGKAGARMHTSGLTDICQRLKRECTCSPSKIPFCTEWMPLSPGEFLRGMAYFRKKPAILWYCCWEIERRAEEDFRLVLPIWRDLRQIFYCSRATISAAFVGENFNDMECKAPSFCGGNPALLP